MAINKLTVPAAAPISRQTAVEPNQAPANVPVAARHVQVDAFKQASTAPRPTTLHAEASRSSHLHTVWQDDLVKITSDENLTVDQAKAVAKKIEDASAFDIAQQGWKDTTPLKKQLTVEVLSKAGFDKVLGGDSTGVAGVTMNANLMAVPDELITRHNPDDDDTIAHEVSHVQDFREGGKGLDTSVPIYVQEGKAYTLGDMYPISLHEDDKDPVLGGIATSLSKLTGAQAQDVMDHYRTAADESAPGRDGFRDETTGALYVQFLKARMNGGAADAVPKLAQVIADVGKGSKYDAAFKKQFGVTPKESETQFVKFVKDTEGKPAERLKGTIWAPYLRAAPTLAADTFKAS